MQSRPATQAHRHAPGRRDRARDHRAGARAARCGCAELEFEEHLFGGASIDAHGTALTDEVLAACRGADAVLLAAVGGPKWDTTDPHKPRPEQGLLGLRKGLGLYANLRPVRADRRADRRQPAAAEVIEGTDMLVVRELTGGIYFGEKTRTEDSASDVCAYTAAEIERIARDRVPARRGRRSSQRRQGERARDEPALARGRAPRPRRRVPERRARAPARRQRRDDSSSPRRATST